MPPRSRTITIFLLKDAQADPATILKNLASLTALPITIREEECGTLYVQDSADRVPNWLSLFQGSANLRAVRTVNSSTAAVWLVNLRERRFAVTFGYGRNLLRSGSWEEDFGLKVTLNAVDSTKIKSVDRMTLDAISQQSRIQASRDADITEFGLDIEQDLLRAVIGTPLDSTLGTRLTGKDPLQATLAARLDQLPGIVERYLDEFGKEDYRARFPWVAQIHEVKDPLRQAELDNVLVQKLRQGDLQSLWLAVPEMMDWEGLQGFKYRVSRRAPIHPDIHARAFLDSVDDVVDLDDYTLKKRYHVHAVSNENDAVVRQWPVYRCLYCEVVQGDGTYLLNNGRWFRIAADFVQRINESIAAIPQAAINFPGFRDTSEAAYCRRVQGAEPARFALMDQDLIRFPGLPTPIEFCDLFTADRRIIHLKRYTGSSGLSHLFAQGYVSARLFVGEPAFRREINARLPAGFQLADPEQKPQPGEYEVVFGIISQSRNPLTLPFFSRVNLKNAYANLTDIGYRVSVTKIPAHRD